MNVITPPKPKKLPCGFGAEYQDIDLTKMSNKDIERLLVDKIANYKILIFREQHLTHRDLVRIASAVGSPITPNPKKFCVPGFPEVMAISNIVENGIPIGVYDGDFEEEWHCDHSFNKIIPSVSMLYSVYSAQEGGATRFSHTSEAFCDLPLELRRLAEEGQAFHSLKHLSDVQAQAHIKNNHLSDNDVLQEAWHDIVVSSQFCGQKSLLLGSSVIQEVSPKTENMRSIINELEIFCIQPKYLYQHQWCDFDLVIWDNLSVMHTASPCDSKKNRRLLYRVLSS